MAVKISDVNISPREVTVGQKITITITAVDVTWGVIKNEFEDWNDVKSDLSSWNSVINYH